MILTVERHLDLYGWKDRLTDQQRSRVDLLSKIARLNDSLREAEKKLETEKDKRKKKEKSLMKLAKELKKRTSQKDKDADRLEEVRYCVVSRSQLYGMRYLVPGMIQPSDKSISRP